MSDLIREESHETFKQENDNSRGVENNPAPFSQALGIPTLIGESGSEEKSAKSRERNSVVHTPTPENSNRATTPAAPPREDAASLIGVPSNHQQTELSGRLAKLDKAAVVLGAIMTIGPLFAAMVGRMGM